MRVCVHVLYICDTCVRVCACVHPSCIYVYMFVMHLYWYACMLVFVVRLCMYVCMGVVISSCLHASMLRCVYRGVGVQGMHVCMYARMSTYCFKLAYTHVHTYAHVYIYIYIYILYIYIYMCVCVCVCVCVRGCGACGHGTRVFVASVHACMHFCMHACVHACMCMNACVYRI